ncbi:MAG: hypothetical protein HYT97_00265 [Elusimicrobia bacterium]|nr:hypothetical protein [Elusimicrobiota bacterium]
MENFKAVEFMRKTRKDLDRKYIGLSLEERVKKMQEEVENDPFWKKFLKKHRVTTTARK